MGILSRITDRIACCYKGKHIPPPKDDFDGDLVIVSSGHYEQPLAAKVLGAIGRLIKAEWKWSLGFFVAIVSLVVAALAVYVNYSHIRDQDLRINQAREVSRQEILRELQMGRDIIAYGVLYHTFEPPWRRPVPPAPLSLGERIPEVFAGDQTFAADASKLSKSLRVGIAQLQDLDSFLFRKSPDYEKRVLGTLRAIVEEADRVGPIVAQAAVGKWETPPTSYSRDQLISYYQERLPKIASDSYALPYRR